MLKKILSHFLLPPGIFIALLLFASLWFAVKRMRKAGITVFIITAAMWLLTITPVSDFMLRGLEAGYTLPKDPSGDVIVLLGGGVNDTAPDMSGVGVPSADMMSRMVTAFRLQKRLGVPVIVSGGSVYKNKKPEAPIVKRVLVDMGIPDNKVIAEDRSRDTHENARFTKKIVEKMKFRKIILVTSAFHMKRSVMSFEKVGLEVIPFPTDFLTQADRKYTWKNYLPGDFQKASLAMHEYLGLLFYKFAY